MTRALVARLDALGDVLLAGPAVRAVAAEADVTFLCGRRGWAAADLLPGVSERLCFTAPWIEPDAAPVSREEIDALVDAVRRRDFDVALILTSFHQDPLPLALLLRLAGVPRIGAVCEDYPGSLLDVRHLVDDSLHEVERGLSLAAAMGFAGTIRGGDRLAVRGSRFPASGLLPPRYVVVHPGASVPARAWHPVRHARVVDLLLDAGHRVVVTGSAGERDLTAQVAGPPGRDVIDLGGATDLATLAAVLRDAAAVVVANTGPAHLAAAVGTPVVSIFAPTVPVERWRPWGVPSVVLGAQTIACRGCRATECPVAGHPCVSAVEPETVVAAVASLIGGRHLVGVQG